MTAPEVDTNEEALLTSARKGDEEAFAALTGPLQREIHVHCYRMLGSLDDAEDALQETLLRAWRYLDRFESRSSFRAWLYRIATNVCLTLLERRARRKEVDLAGVGIEGQSASGQEEEPVRLQPYPDRLLDESWMAGDSPETLVERREDVELAFCAAIQALPARQRATLLLRDVIGYPAAEVATMLETTVAGVNSALQRARDRLALEQNSGTIARRHASPGAATERRLVERLISAWHAADVPSIVAILTEDALFSMPPQPQYFIGREAIAGFLSTVPAGGRLDRFRMVPTRANRQPALASYYRDGDRGAFHAHGIIVLSFQGEAIASICRFGDASVFPRFGLPPTVED
jgi:RNA polymerase sigma-70 factor (TIGR02960 family)